MEVGVLKLFWQIVGRFYLRWKSKSILGFYFIWIWIEYWYQVFLMFSPSGPLHTSSHPTPPSPRLDQWLIGLTFALNIKCFVVNYFNKIQESVFAGDLFLPDLQKPLWWELIDCRLKLIKHYQDQPAEPC